MLERLARAVSPRIVETPARARPARGASSTSTSPDAGARFDLALDWALIGPFARRVLAQTAAIPYGGVLSYSEVAAEAGQPARLARGRQRARAQTRSRS